MGDKIQTVTFGVIAYNEQIYLPDLLEDLLKQTYSKSLTEVILVDGDSTDNTRQIMETFKAQHDKEYLAIKLLHNNKRIQPAGWNVVIQNATAEVIFRIDAHARLPKNFIEKSMECINNGEYVCGGPRENIIDEDTAWKRMLLEAEQSLFGSGIASYRQKTEHRRYVKSLFHGAYRKEVFDKVGLFDEKLVRTEDNEMHYRIREAGYRICYEPTIKSYYQTRNTLRGMLRQKYQNGLWIGKTLFVCPNCISLFHMVPFAFVCAIILSSVLSLFGIKWPALCLWIAYGLANLLMTITAIVGIKNKSLCSLTLPFIFLLLHLSYGIGTMKGVLSMIIKNMFGGGNKVIICYHAVLNRTVWTGIAA